MTRDKEFAAVAEALSEASITKINETCRLILKERTASIICTDNEVRRLADIIVSGYSPLIETSITRHVKTSKAQASDNQKIICAVLGIAGLLVATFFISIVWRLLGSAALGTAAFMGALIWERSKTKEETTYKCKIKQSVEDVINELDTITATLKRLLEHNQLESQYSPVLTWLQDLWAESDKELQKDICKLLNRINYEFVDYSEEISEYFDANKAAGIEEPETTRPAIRSKATGYITARGYVIVPMSN